MYVSETSNRSTLISMPLRQKMKAGARREITLSIHHSDIEDLRKYKPKQTNKPKLKTQLASVSGDVIGVDIFSEE